MLYLALVRPAISGPLPCQQQPLPSTLQSRCFIHCHYSAGAADVQQAVQFAAAHNLDIAVKGGGWSYVSSHLPLQTTCSVVCAAEQT